MKFAASWSMGTEDMEEFFESRESRDAAVQAAMLGCAICGGMVRVPPAGDPFSGGPWRGRYLCQDDWTLYYSEHPEHLADQATVNYIKREAEKIKLERATKDAEILFKEGESMVFLTSSGTIAFRLEKSDSMASEEYDPARFELLVRALQAVDQAAVPGYTFAAKTT